MSIYKLGDIGFFKNGIGNLDKTKYDKGYYFINYMDVFNNMSIKNCSKLRKYNASSNDLKKYEVLYGDALFTGSSETKKEIAISCLYLNNKKAILNGFCKRFRYDKKILNPLYAQYLFRSKSFRQKVQMYCTGYTRYNISQTNLNKIEIYVPNLTTQQKIIDIIEPIIKLINYSEKIVILLKRINKLVVSFGGFYYKINDLILNINKGFAYKKNHLNPTGIYKIFTIRNIMNKSKYKCTDYVFKNLLKIGNVITGLSGSLGTATVINENNWVSNQRTLSFKTNYSLQIQEAIIENSDEIKSLATGSVQKNITAEDILNLQIKISNRETLKLISQIHLVLLRINLVLKSVKIKYIDILIK